MSGRGTAVPIEEVPVPDPSDTPWWYSGDEAADAATEPNEAGESRDNTGAGSGDLLAWMSRAVGLVDWAAGAVVEPHADHREPADHPDCLICRTLAVVADRTGLTPPQPDQPFTSPPPEPAEPIRWIPVRRARH